MKQLLILSGKGGTGKTTVASAFIRLSKSGVYADCDVDAPNLHLITSIDTNPVKTDYNGMPKAEINTKQCIECDNCRKNCRFDAIEIDDKKRYKVNLFSCEGCGVCEFVCPSEAISLRPFVDGELMLFTDKNQIFSTAQLKMGSGTSGLLVTEVKKQIREAVEDLGSHGIEINRGFGNQSGLAIIDGSPGIGCPVIASISGVDMVLIVSEPSISGISDMERILKTAEGFGVKTVVCVNKCDTNLAKTDEIKEFCLKKNIPYVGEIPYDQEAVKAINDGKSIVEIPCRAGDSVKKVYAATLNQLFN